MALGVGGGGAGAIWGGGGGGGRRGESKADEKGKWILGQHKRGRRGFSLKIECLSVS